jgi:DNA-binding NarL/FixJ family response regulator
MLSQEKSIAVVGVASDGAQLLQLLETQDADVALVDIDMPVLNGIKTCQLLTARFPHIRTIALTMIEEASIIRKMLEAGARGYLLKNTGLNELLKCINTVYSGRTYYSSEVAQVIMQNISGIHDQKMETFPRLSRREKQVLQLITHEHTTGEIAESLNISSGTVETHRRNIMHKLGTRNTAGMVRIAVEHGLLMD